MSTRNVDAGRTALTNICADRARIRRLVFSSTLYVCVIISADDSLLDVFENDESSSGTCKQSHHL